jgi:predicted DNA-binding transcriptional regulator AlpA
MATRRKKKRDAHFRKTGTACVWPSGIEARYDISAPTRWRWERDGRLPPRDVFIGGQAAGWRPETLDRADRGQQAQV